MDAPLEQQFGNEEMWRTVFAKGDPILKKMQWWNSKLPQKPRCKLCMAPFEGIGGWIMRRRGKARNSRNPNFCNACDGFLEAFPGGAEIDMSMLYVDVRQSTEYAVQHTAADVSERINQFLNLAIDIITANDGFIQAFYGDCIVAAWPPGFCGSDHAIKSQNAALALVHDKRMVAQDGKPIPIGVGVHSGKVFISTVSALKGTFRDVSIFGSNVNLTARLASRAKAQEVLASAENIIAADAQIDDFECELAELKGFSDPVKVYKIAGS